MLLISATTRTDVLMIKAVAMIVRNEITISVVELNLIWSGKTPARTMLITSPTAGITRMMATR